MFTAQILIGIGVLVAVLGVAAWLFWPKQVEEMAQEAMGMMHHLEETAEDKIERLQLDVRRSDMLEAIDNDHLKRTIMAHMDIGHALALALTTILASVAFYHVQKTTDSTLTAAGFAIAILLVPVAANFLSWSGTVWSRIFLFFLGMLIIAAVMFMNWSILQSAAGEQTQVALGKKEVQAGDFVDSRARRKALIAEIKNAKESVKDSPGVIKAAIVAQLDRTWSGRTVKASTNNCEGVEVRRRSKITIKRMNRFERGVCDAVRKLRAELAIAKSIISKQKEADALQVKILSGRTTSSSDVQSEELSRLLGISQDRLQKVIPMLLLSLLDMVHLLFWIGLGIMDQGKLRKQKENLIKKIEADVEISRLQGTLKRENQAKVVQAGTDVDHVADANAFIDEMAVPVPGEFIAIMDAFKAYWIWLEGKGRKTGMPRAAFKRAVAAAAAGRGMTVTGGNINGHKLR